jgi:PAP2 superfamily protein
MGRRGASRAASDPLVIEPAAVPTGPWPYSKRFRFGWIGEGLAIIAASSVYEFVRNSTQGKAADALRNAKVLTSVERTVGIYQERAFQHFFLDVPALVAFWNIYYDTMHFVVPIFVGIYLYMKAPARYVRMRNTFLFLILGLSQIAWWAFPVTSPRWMPARYGFVDTQVKYFNLGAQKPLRYIHGEPAPDVVVITGNPYGGMPSHHVSWAMFSVLALWPVVRRRWVKGLLIGHFLLTIGAITVTGQHRFIDIAGSAIELTIAYALAIALEGVLERRRERRLLLAAGAG